MRKNLRRLLELTTAIALGVSPYLATHAAHAADFLENPEIPVTQVEFGTGWYIRGDIGITAHETLRVTTQAPGGNGIAPLVETEDIDNVFSTGVGVGRRFSPNFRADIGYSYMAESETSRRQTATTFRPPCSNAFRLVTTVDANGNQITNEVGGQTITNCVEESQTSYFLQSLTANGYYDFDTSIAGLRPFIGLGGGLVRAQYTSTSNDVTCAAGENERCNPTDGNVVDYGETYTQEYGRNNGTSYHLAGSAFAGLSYALTETLFLDATYQYTHMFDEPIWGGTNGIQAANIPTDFHTFKIGLRLEIW